MEDFARIVAKHAARCRFEDLPPEVVDVTKKSILDVLGAMVAASSLGEGCSEVVELVKRAGSKPESTIIGYGVKSSSWLAAFANGAMAHAIDYGDTYDIGYLHPSEESVPAAFAIAEPQGTVSGKTLITAIALSNDLVSRLGRAVTKRLAEHGWMSSQVCGIFAAALASGKVVDLDDDSMLAALSFALAQSGGSGQIIWETGSALRSIRDSFTGQAGVLSALLAKKGLKGVQNPLEGRSGLFNLHFRGEYNAESLRQDYGQRYEGAYVRFKPYPACSMSQGFIEAILGLSEEHNIKPDNVAEITLRVTDTTKTLCEPLEERRRPPSAIDAKVALPFTAAVALVRRKVTLAEYMPETLKDPEVLALSRRVNYLAEPGFGHRNLEPAGVMIKCKDGREYGRYIEYSYGHPLNPISKEDLIAKFKDCCRYSVEPVCEKNQNRVIDMVTHLEEVPNVGEIISLLG